MQRSASVLKKTLKTISLATQLTQIRSGFKVQTWFLSNCNGTLLEKRSANVWMKKSKRNLIGDTVDSNSLPHERKLGFS